ncbi:MAG: hypothetical protein HFF87_02530 [Oscillibacter sp.]|jgi:hypothetical protein|nr:hypothetical protein [Oscillibacter sp.]
MTKKQVSTPAMDGETPVKPDQPKEGPPAVKAALAEGNRSGIYCYIGPNLAGLLQHGAIFRGSREDALRAAADAVRQYPVVKTLIVSGDALPDARIQVKTPGNALYVNARRLAGN